MSTLKEIEAAADKLPVAQLEELLVYLAERLHRSQPMREQDPFDGIIGAFSGPIEATGRRAEEILA